MSSRRNPSPKLTARTGGELFIVDNSISGWTGAKYLHDWTDLARGIDIATGFFEIGSLLELDGKWQQLEKIRILMGAEVTHSTKAAFIKATKDRAEAVLDNSIEAEKEKKPFLHGVPAVVEALRSGQIECRVYLKDKFHAKAYITHAKLDVIGAQALVGSSNFTRPGLTQNIELNIQVQSGREVAQLQDWYEQHWNDADDVTPDVLQVIERHVRPYSPFEVYAKALEELFRGHEMTAGEWDQSGSTVFPKLDRYQQEGYWALMKIARQHGGAFLCDGVGLGKTFIGLMLIERLVMHEGKNVVLFAPKAAKDAVWDPHLREHLPQLAGGLNVLNNLAVFSHTDLGRGGDYPVAFERITQFADAVIVDEAHHFRNPGRAGSEDGNESRYRKLQRIVQDGPRGKQLFLLTATPINNRLSDFRHMIELFTGGEEGYFGPTLGINNLRAHFANLEKALRQEFGHDDLSEAGALMEAQDVLTTSPAFQALVVQRSRAYAKQSQEQEKGEAAAFPRREKPRVAEYSIKKTYSALLDSVEKAFSKDKPLFSLAIYYPLAYYTGPDASIDPIENNRQYQVVGLIRTNFLKRFESSVWAFEQSCERLLKKLLAFIEVHSESDADRRRLERWKLQNQEMLGYAAQLTLPLDGEGDDLADDDLLPPELLEKTPVLEPREHYSVDEIIDETYLDLDEIIRFLAETRKFEPRQDDKLQKLIRLLRSRDISDEKVLVFTEFADTARYLEKHLGETGIEGVEELDSSSKKDRAEVIRRFSPYYNGSSSAEVAASGKQEIKVLIATDVLSEGLNLQDATRLINYDIHWNPVRLMQRIGRVDRRMNPAVEERMKADHPALAANRGRVIFWNFLPPGELNDILTLYARVTQKVLLISKTMGIEHGKLLTPEDDLEVIKEFNHAYEGETTAVEELHLEYQRLLEESPGLADVLDRLPGSVFSGRERDDAGLRGVFFCYALPALDRELGEFTHEAGTTRWFFFDDLRDQILEEPGEIIDAIRSTPETPRVCSAPVEALLKRRDAVRKHIKNGYLKQVDAPVGVVPALRCWMEVGG